MNTAGITPHVHGGDAGPLDGCCGPRGAASAAMARAMLGGLRVPDLTDRRDLPARGGRDGRDATCAAAHRRPARIRPPGRVDRADLLVVGSVATGNPARPLAGAMAVRDGRIVALGSADELDGLRGTDTEIVEAGDGVVIPGLVEPHMHLWSTGVFYGWQDCSYASNPRLDDVVARLKEAVGAAKPGEWVCGELLDPSRYPGEPDLTSAILDQVSTEVPIVVANASMHFMYVNSKVFELAGITAETPDPPSGTFYRANGKLTGVVGELNALLAVIAHIPQKSTEDLAAAMRAIMSRAASQGVTSMREAMTGQLRGPDEVGMLHQMNAADRLPTRLSLAQSAMLGHRAWADAGIVPGGGDDMVRTDAWKIMADGSNQGRSAFLRSPYLGGMGGNGAANFSVQELTGYIREGHEAGWQVMVHANGDAGIDLTLTAYEGALAGVAPHDQRHRIEHVSIGHPEHFSRMARSGISPSFLINHVYYWGQVLRDNILGSERAAGLHRVHTAVAHGLRPSLHSDYNVSPIQPLLAARTAVLRQTETDGQVLGPDECVDAETALRAITVDAAWQIHADDRGSLEVGKLADFAIVSDDPWSIAPERWADITVSETRLGGTVAWQA
jgi:predicted amidohydrolase YtcJ